jgi:hypothetical protein
MDSNSFIYVPKIDLEIEKIKKIVFESQFNVDSKLSAAHHRNVANHPYLQEIKSRYNFLSDTYNIYTLPGKKIIPLHVDAHRSAAFNIPIKNTKESKTIFYEYIEEPILEYDPKNIFNRIRSNVKEIFKFTLLEPTLINNSIPHMVVNDSSEPRIILSWSIQKELKFEDIRDKF